MKERRFIVNLLIRLFLLIAVSVAAGWSLSSEKPLFLSLIFIITAIITIADLYRYVNKVNQQINYFFEAVKNEDFTLRMPFEPGDSILNELYRNMETVNKLIQNSYMQNRQMEQYFKSMIEHAATGIFSFDRSGFVKHANSAFRKMIGRDVFTHIRQLEQTYPELYKAIVDIGPSDHRVVTISNESGITQLSVKAVSFSDQTSELLLLAVQDIRQALDEKELDSWLKLIRVLMHEIMNSIAPITSIADSLSGYLKTEGKPLTPAQMDENLIRTTIRGLEIIREQGKGLTSFVESYRKLTRLPVPEIKSINVKNMVDDCIMLARAMDNSAHIEMVVVYQDEELLWACDEQLIKQVLVNLLQNSIQALEYSEQAKIEIGAGLNDSHKLEICVKDNGPGIAPEIIDQIFVPFFTTKPNGSGIGLSISRQIMRLHKGSLTVRSTPGKETIFCMVL